MTRNLRNFWAHVYGERRSVSTGGKDIRVDIYQRKDGAITMPITIMGYPVGDELRLDVNVRGKNVFSITTDR